MGQGIRLTASSRKHIRDVVRAEYTRHIADQNALKCLKEIYRDLPASWTYALAFYGALDTAEPVDLARVRDSRS